MKKKKDGTIKYSQTKKMGFAEFEKMEEQIYTYSELKNPILDENTDLSIYFIHNL